MFEKLRTQQLLERWLPRQPAAVLDVGGGPGVHALWLARRGYAVHVVDPVPLHVEQALEASAMAEHPLAGATVGDARRLHIDDERFDVALMLGPLYHLPDRADRSAALTEAFVERELLGEEAPELTRSFAQMMEDYRDGNVGAFNKSLASYRKELLQSDPANYVDAQIDFEAQFNRLSPFTVVGATFLRRCWM